MRNGLGSTSERGLMSGSLRPMPICGNATRRRAAIYVLVLSMSLIIATIGITALMALRITLRSAQWSNDMAAARFYAQSALEYGLMKMNQDPSWRVNIGPGAWASSQNVGRGSFSLTLSFLTDGDGDPQNDPALLTGTGSCGISTHIMQVTVLQQNGQLVTQPGSWKQATAGS